MIYMHLFAAVLGILASSTGGVPWAGRRSDDCDRHWEDPCQHFFANFKPESKEQSVRMFCKVAPAVIKCVNDSLDIYISRAEDCLQQTPFGGPTAILRTRLYKLQAANRVMCALSATDAANLLRCYGPLRQSIKRCEVSSAASLGFTEADLYRQTEKTPTVETFCEYADDAYDCIVNVVSSNCGTMSREFAQVTGNFTVRWPFDYNNICVSSEETGFDLVLQQQAASMYRRQENDVLAVLFG